MTYQLDFTPAALRDLKRLPESVRAGIVSAIETLTDDPRPQGCEKIEGSSDLYRIRRGEYRVLYNVLDDVLTVVVVRARHRREVYKNVTDLLKRRR